MKIKKKNLWEMGGRVERGGGQGGCELRSAFVKIHFFFFFFGGGVGLGGSGSGGGGSGWM